jgi:ElaB/YqjD/DUF883 family membrane-anchored ribosome-binding protein
MTETQTGNAAATGEQTSGNSRLQDAAGQIRGKVSHAYDTAVTKATDALDGARGKAADARQRAASGIEDNPFAVVMGGLALGLIAGAMLPRTQREAQLLGSVGKGVKDAARTASVAARDAGKEAFDELGLNRDAVRDQVSKLFDAALKAAGTAGEAAVQSVKQGRDA